MYVCGPTVYADAHIGHAMSAMVFDVIRRYLEFAGYEVKHAQNFTDIDDKIINRANAEGRDPNELAEEYINQWLDQTAALNVKPATVYPRATQELGNIHAMIQTLIDKGNAYPMDGDVYYRVRSFDGYGKLSHRSLEDMRAGERVAVDERKEDPMDFALWKGVKPGEPAWDSPWGGGQARLAHRVLGDDQGASRRPDRHPRRRRGPDLPAPRERNRPERGGARRGALRALLDPQRPLADEGPEDGRDHQDVQVARQPHHDRRSARPGATARTSSASWSSPRTTARR